MVESIKDLKKIVHSGKNEAAYIRFCRRFSIYITKLLLHTPITPNQVTLIGILITIIGSALLLTTSPYPVIGGFLLILGFVFDCVDGEIARYKKVSSIGGAFIDDFSFYLIETLPFVTLTLYAWYTYNNFIFVLLGISALFSLMMSRIMIERRHFLVSVSILKDKQKIKALIDKKSSRINNKKIGKGSILLLLEQFYDKIYYIFILPGIVLVVLLSAFLEHQEYTLIVYGLLAPLFLLINILYQFYTADNDKFVYKY